MTHIQSKTNEPPPECFLVRADGLVQSVLRRYSDIMEKTALAKAVEGVTDSPIVALS